MQMMCLENMSGSWVMPMELSQLKGGIRGWGGGGVRDVMGGRVL